MANDLIAQIFMGAVAKAGKIKVTDILAKIKENNTPEVYENALKTGNGFFSLLNTLAEKTKTDIDDDLISVFHDPIQKAAKEGGITL